MSYKICYSHWLMREKFSMRRCGVFDVDERVWVEVDVDIIWMHIQSFLRIPQLDHISFWILMNSIQAFLLILIEYYGNCTKEMHLVESFTESGSSIFSEIGSSSGLVWASSRNHSTNESTNESCLRAAQNANSTHKYIGRCRRSWERAEHVYRIFKIKLLMRAWRKTTSKSTNSRRKSLLIICIYLC